MIDEKILLDAFGVSHRSGDKSSDINRRSFDSSNCIEVILKIIIKSHLNKYLSLTHNLVVL